MDRAIPLRERDPLAMTGLFRGRDRQLVLPESFSQRRFPGFTADKARAADSLDRLIRYRSDPACRGVFVNHDPTIREQQLTLPLQRLRAAHARTTERSIFMKIASSADGKAETGGLLTADSEQLARIRAMEQALNEAAPAAAALLAALEAYEAVLPQLRSLAAYCESPLWLQDHDADRAGRLPADLPRGVLSQDALYDLLCDSDRLRQELRRLEKKLEKEQTTS